MQISLLLSTMSEQSHRHDYRDGYGQERYEKLEMQKCVAKQFKHLEDGRFAIIDARRPVHEVSQDVKAVAAAVIARCQKNICPLGKLWEQPSFSIVDVMHTATQ